MLDISRADRVTYKVDFRSLTNFLRNHVVEAVTQEFDRCSCTKIQSDSEVLLVIGIGGSYLGARAAIEFLRHSFYNMIPKEVRKTPEIYFVGNSISSTYIKHLMEIMLIEKSLSPMTSIKCLI